MVFFAAPSDVTLPKVCHHQNSTATSAILTLSQDCGDTGVLVGSVTYESIAAGVAGASKRPTGYDFVFHPAPRGADAPKPKTPGDEKSELQKIQTAIRDFELQKLKSLRGDDFKKAYKELSQAHVHFGDPAGGDEADLDEASELGALEAWLEHVDSDWACPDNDPAAVVQAADAVLAKIDQDALAEHFGMEVDSTNVGMLRMRAKMTAQRNTLLSALRRRARAALVATGIRSTLLAEGGEEATAVFESSMAQLRCWCDVQKAPECALLLIEAAMRNKQFGEALRLVSQSLAASVRCRLSFGCFELILCYRRRQRLSQAAHPPSPTAPRLCMSCVAACWSSWTGACGVRRTIRSWWRVSHRRCLCSRPTSLLAHGSGLQIYSAMNCAYIH